MPLAVIVLALLLWWCTAMIYACLRFIQEWATPLTFFNYLLIGMASGMSLYAALALLAGLGPTCLRRRGLGGDPDRRRARGARRLAGAQRAAQAEVDAAVRHGPAQPGGRADARWA